MQIPGIVCVLPFLGAAIGALPVSASAQESPTPPLVVLVPVEEPLEEPAEEPLEEPAEEPLEEPEVESPIIVERVAPPEPPAIVERVAPAPPPVIAPNVAPAPTPETERSEASIVIVIATEAPPSAQSESYLQPAEPDADLRMPEAQSVEEQEERYPVFSVGLSGSLALADGAGGDVEPLASYGLDLAVRPLPFLVLALRRVGAVAGETLGGTRVAIGATPTLALALRFGFFEPYVEVGAALQSRVAGDQDSAIGVAPHGAIGARFFITRWLSLGAEGALEVAATDAFLLTPSSLPQGAVWLSGGASVTFHVE